MSQKIESVMGITMEYEGEVITRYFKNVDNFPFLYPGAKELSHKYVSSESLLKEERMELERIYKEEIVFG